MTIQARPSPRLGVHAVHRCHMHRLIQIYHRRNPFVELCYIISQGFMLVNSQRVLSQAFSAISYENIS